MRKKHLLLVFYYLILFIIVSLGIILFNMFSGWPDRQFLTIVIFAFFYFLWGVIFHRLNSDFHVKIVIEYLLIALLAIVLMRGVVYFTK